MLNFNIGDFFKRIGAIQGKEIIIRQVIQQTIKDVAGFDIKIEEITLKSGVISIKNLSSSAKSVLFIRKNSIIEKINTSQSSKVVTDLR